jgi:hypothetical protein
MLLEMAGVALIVCNNFMWASWCGAGMTDLSSGLVG